MQHERQDLLHGRIFFYGAQFNILCTGILYASLLRY